MSFIDEEKYRIKRAGKKKHKGIVISSIAGTIVGASLFAFGAPLFSNHAGKLPQAEASEKIWLKLKVEMFLLNRLAL